MPPGPCSRGPSTIATSAAIRRRAERAVYSRAQTVSKYRASAAGCARRAPPRLKRDLAAGSSRHDAGKLGDADLLRGADVIDAEMLALVAHDQHPTHQVVDVAKAARLSPAALDRERHRPGRLLADSALEAHGKLRNDVLE